MSEDYADRDHHKLCEVGVEYETERTESGDYDVKEEGYMCPNDAVGKFEHETQHGPNIETWLCKEHRDKWKDDGIIVREVTP